MSAERTIYIYTVDRWWDPDGVQHDYLQAYEQPPVLLSPSDALKIPCCVHVVSPAEGCSAWRMAVKEHRERCPLSSEAAA